jgi:hypothetical protein
VYDHTRIASYWHWWVGNVGRRVWLLALDGRNAELAGGFPSDPILSGPRQTEPKVAEMSSGDQANRAENLVWFGEKKENLPNYQ